LAVTAVGGTVQAPTTVEAMATAVSTRELLLDSAARLFAERGIDNVSTAEIVRGAGQRNTSAVHYYFGNRDEVLRALLARHVPDIAKRRRELLVLARTRTARDVRSAAEAVVRPVTELAPRGWRERAYLQIGSELATGRRPLSPGIRDVMNQTAGREAWDLLRQRCPKVPPDLWRARQEICIVFVGRAAADRAWHLDQGGRRVLPEDRFVDNLIEMLLGAMRARHHGA